MAGKERLVHMSIREWGERVGYGDPGVVLAQHWKVRNSGYFGLCDQCENDIEGHPVEFWEAEAGRGLRHYCSFDCMVATEACVATKHERLTCRGCQEAAHGRSE